MNIPDSKYWFTYTVGLTVDNLTEWVNSWGLINDTADDYLNRKKGQKQNNGN